MPRALADETLVAYVDGELDPAARRAVEAGLEHDPEAARKVATMRRSAVALRGAFDEIMSEPIPERLRATIDRGLHARSASETWFDRATRWLMSVTAPRQLAFAGGAAALALVVGIGIGQWQGGGAGVYMPAGIAPSGDAVFAAAVAHAMATDSAGATASYERAEIGVSGTITVLGAIDIAPGILCRAFRDEARSADLVVTGRGIACRGADGVWANLVVPEPAAP